MKTITYNYSLDDRLKVLARNVLALRVKNMPAALFVNVLKKKNYMNLHGYFWIEITFA